MQSKGTKASLETTLQSNGRTGPNEKVGKCFCSDDPKDGRQLVISIDGMLVIPAPGKCQGGTLHQPLETKS